MSGTLRIKLLAMLREVTGDAEIGIPLPNDATISDLLEEIQKDYPALYARLVAPNGDLVDDVHIYRNGRNVTWIEGLNTAISPSDVITLIPHLSFPNDHSKRK
ncbi:MAG: MoaD/ThiS family protein [Chloroflexi bacterium]|nr:MoaD/ThiS family protein [Chloroflexota bacterium]